MIARLYNTGSIITRGSFEFSDERGEVSFDLTSDPANATFSNPGLIDYKDENFVLNKQMWCYDVDKKEEYYVLDNSKLSAGELEFVKAVGCYLGEANANPTTKHQITPWGLNKETVEIMKSTIDSGKVIIVGATTFKINHPQALAGIEDAVIGGHTIYFMATRNTK